MHVPQPWYSSWGRQHGVQCYQVLQTAMTCQKIVLIRETRSLPILATPVLTDARHVQARCRGDLFVECSRLDDKVPVSHEEQMSTLRKVGSYVCQAAHPPMPASWV